MATQIKDNPIRSLEKTGGAGLRTFFRIADAWKLNEREQMALLGLQSRSALYNWKAGKVDRVGADTLERLSYVFGIFKGVGTLIPDENRADAWMRAPNQAPLFGGRSALDRMTSGHVADLFQVRQYIDAARG